MKQKQINSFKSFFAFKNLMAGEKTFSRIPKLTERNKKVSSENTNGF